MNASRLIDLIKYPEAINKEDLLDLKSLTEVYPFFSSGHLLYLYGLKKENDRERFDLQLKESAVHISDREVLYRLLKHQGKKEPETTKPTIEVKPLPVAVVEEEKSTPVYQTPPLAVKENKRLAEIKLLDDIFASEEELEALELDENPLNTLNEVLAVSKPGTAVAEMPTEKVQETPETVDATSAEIPKVVYTAPVTPEVVEPAKPAVKAQKMNLASFNDWLKNKMVENEAPKSVSKEDIIEKFIKTEPKLSRPKKEFFNPIEAGKKSLEDDESIVSETLAKVYADSGEYEKAISTYKKLSLLIPEKSTFFAAQIYELEIKNSLE